MIRSSSQRFSKQRQSVGFPSRMYTVKGLLNSAVNFNNYANNMLDRKNLISK